MEKDKIEKGIDEIVERMSQCLDDFETGNGASENEILVIENEFDVKLPHDYRYFLIKYGYVDWDGNCILGICHDEELQSYYSMPYFTKSDRSKDLPKGFMKRPSNTVVVGPYGGGGHYFLYCDNSDSPSRVSLLLTELQGYADKTTWCSFSDFLNHYVYGKKSKNKKRTS